MEELKKIDLHAQDTESLSNTSSKTTHMQPKRRFSRKTIPVLIIVLLILGGLFLAVFFPAQKTYGSAMKTYKQAKKAWEAAKKQNVALAGKELEQAKKDLRETRENFSQLSFVKYIPVMNWYYNDAEHLLKASEYGLDAAIVVVDSVKPYADLLGLKGQGSFVMGSAEERVKLAVLTMGKITPQIDKVSESFVKAKEEIDAVEDSHYPSFIAGGKIRKQLQGIKKVTDEGVTAVEEARPLIKVLPSLLGESTERRYLILFQNDKELRPTGGFITAYSVFKIDKGIIHVDTSDDIYTLDNSIAGKTKAPDPILKYFPKVSVLNLRDSNLSPDYIESMKTFETLYNKSSRKTKVDGIIALDTHVLVSVIKILDDEVIAGGIKFTSKTDPRCECPQVIYELEDNISRPVGYEREGRKDLLGVLLYAIMEKALKSSPRLYWGPLMQEMITQVERKHVLFYLYDTNAQVGVEALNAAGRIKKFDGNYLHINQANFGGAKANLFVKETVDVNIQTAGDGTITNTVTVSYKNPHEPSDCNLERGGLCLNAPLRGWIRVYVPKGSKLGETKGSEVKVTSYDELGKTVFEGFLTVRPLGSATYTLTYTLPFKLQKGSPLPLLIQKQPGTEENQYTIKLNGREVHKFTLLTDKQLSLKL